MWSSNLAYTMSSCFACHAVRYIIASLSLILGFVTVLVYIIHVHSPMAKFETSEASSCLPNVPDVACNPSNKSCFFSKNPQQNLCTSLLSCLITINHRSSREHISAIFYFCWAHLCLWLHQYPLYGLLTYIFYFHYTSLLSVLFLMACIFTVTATCNSRSSFFVFFNILIFISVL